MHSESESIALQTPTESLVVCYMYNPPKSSPYRAPASQIQENLEEIEKQIKQRDNYTLIGNGDLNLPGADWNSMLSDDDYELSLLNNFGTHRLQQILPYIRNQSLDVCLTQSPDSIELVEIDKKTSHGITQSTERHAPTIKHSGQPFPSTYQLRNQPPK